MNKIIELNSIKKTKEKELDSENTFKKLLNDLQKVNISLLRMPVSIVFSKEEQILLLDISKELAEVSLNDYQKFHSDNDIKEILYNIYLEECEVEKNIRKAIFKEEYSISFSHEIWQRLKEYIFKKITLKKSYELIFQKISRELKIHYKKCHYDM